MASFSRGPLTRLVVCFAPPNISRQAINTLPTKRLFQTYGRLQTLKPSRNTPIQGAKKPAPILKTQPAKAKPAPDTPAILPGTRYAYIRSLVQKGSPTTLYEAPSHAWLKFTAWSTGVLCLSSGAYFFWVYNNPLSGLPFWVNGSNFVFAVAMVWMGSYWALRGKGIVKTIRAVPSLVQIAEVRAGRMVQTPTLDLEVVVKPWVPFLKPSCVMAPYTDVKLGSRVVVPMSFMTPSEKLEKKRREEREKEEARKYELSHLYSAPFRHAARGLRAAFRGFRQALTGGGFGTLVVKEESLRLDLENGWMLNDGKALERIVGVMDPKDDVTAKKWAARLYR